MAIDKVNNNGNPNRVAVSGQSSKVKATNGETASQTQRSRNENSKDTVSITRVGIDLQNALETLADIPIVNINRVEEIKGAIQQNAYKIDFTRVAHKMIEFERTLQGSDRIG